MITLGEIANANSIAHWRIDGREAVVKVVSPSSADRLRLAGDQIRVKGYITQLKYLFGLNAHQIERALGLPPRHLAGGALLFALTRLPRIDEVDFKYSAAWPDGRVPAHGEYLKLLRRRDAAYAGLGEEPSLYPPGGGHIPQWQLRFDRAHPGIPGRLLQSLSGMDQVQRPNGSVKPLSPHNRPVKWGRIL